MKSKFIVEIVTSLVILALILIGVWAVRGEDTNALGIFWLIGIVSIIQLLHALFWKAKWKKAQLSSM